MNWLIRVGGGALLALAMIANAAAAPATGASPSSAIALSGTQSGQLTGDSAGAYGYYTFNYPGDGSTGTLTMTFSPSDPWTANAVGVNVYQDGTLISTMNGVGSPPGTNSLVFSSTTAGPILAQVYNYDQGVPVSFSLSLSGVNPSAAAATTTTTTTTPASSVSGSSADHPISLSKATTGSLAGSSAGAYQYYTLNYPGDGSVPSIGFNFSPNGPDTANGVFVTVYQNGTQIGTAAGTDASQPGQVSVLYTSSVAGPVIVQVANYNPDTTIDYTISP